MLKQKLSFKPFHICPRCSKFHFFISDRCKNCNLMLLFDFYSYIKNDYSKYYTFQVSNFNIEIYEDKTIITEYWTWKILIAINKQLDIKITKDKIIKYLLLL